MAKIQFLTILLVVTCFLGGVISATDMEFEVCTCTGVTMAKIQFLTILLTVTCFLSSVVSITDKEFEVCMHKTV